MDNLPEDQKVVDLLTKLKNSNGGYPAEMLEARRRAYVKQVTNAGLGIGIGAALKHAVKGGGNGSGAATTTVASKILETALIAAIAIEAGTVTFMYRDKIAHAVKSYVNTPVVQEVTAPPEDTVSKSALAEIFEIPSGTPSVTPTSTPSGTPSGTPATALAGNNNGGTNAGVNANGTPNPNENNGNQYGLTPKPERTKENNGGGGGTNEGGNNGGDNGGGGNNGGGHNQP